jgi:hypothetical protein
LGARDHIVRAEQHPDARRGAPLRAFFFVLAIAAVVATGCRPKDADVRLARVAAEKRNLEATFDRLEDRLLANQARVRLWREMRDRHESVSAIACVSQQEHAQEMAANSVAPERPARSLHRARVATAVGPTGPAPARASATR